MQPSYCYQQTVDWAGGWREHFYANEEMQTVEKSLLDELSRKKFRICFTPYLLPRPRSIVHNIGNNCSAPPIWSCYLLKAQHIVLMMPGPLKKWFNTHKIIFPTDSFHSVCESFERCMFCGAIEPSEQYFKEEDGDVEICLFERLFCINNFQLVRDI